MALSTGILAYYKCENTSDSSPNGYTLTNVSSVTFSAGKIDNCANISLRSSSARCLRINNDMGTNGGATTIAGWYLANSNPTGGFGSGDFLCELGTGGSTDTNLKIAYSSIAGSPTFSFWRERAGVANDYYNYVTTLTTGTWYHIAITYTGSTLQGYINGVAVGAGASSSGNGSGTNDNHFILGGISNGVGGSNWSPDGKLDEWGVWNRALSASEIAELYNAGAGLQYPFGAAAGASAGAFFGAGL